MGYAWKRPVCHIQTVYTDQPVFRHITSDKRSIQINIFAFFSLLYSSEAPFRGTSNVDQNNIYLTRKLFKPVQEKTYNKTCATSEDSDQPAYLHSLIRVFTDDMCLLHLRAKRKRRTLAILDGCVGWSEFVDPTGVIAGFVVHSLIYLIPTLIWS